MRALHGATTSRCAALAGLLVFGTPDLAVSESVYFSDLVWDADGTRLRFLAGSGDDLRTLEVEPASGFVRCLDPRVTDPVWSEARGKVLFRDRLGVFEVDPNLPELGTQLVLFLPDASRQFVRAFGADARGRLLVWTFDRRRGEHSLWTQFTDGWQPVPGVLDGSEALRLWEERNRARDFKRVGGQFVRSLCVRQPGTKSRLCLESVIGRFRGRSPFFRVTMGPPGGVEVLQNRCAPSGVTTSADTSHVVVGLFEELDDDGRSEVLSVWVVDWRNGTRVYETLLPKLVDVRARHDCWALWRPAAPLLWADTAGQLLTVSTLSPDARTLVHMPMAAARAPLYRVVALTAPDASTAQPDLERLREGGLDAGLYDAQMHLEVQVGAATRRAHARSRADQLRMQGYSQAREVEGSVEEIAVGMGFGWSPAAAGRGAFVRHIRGQRGVFSEIWYVERSGSTPRLLIPAFEDVDLVSRAGR
jgi:hypothetical protein